jgi:hypothetical protein
MAINTHIIFQPLRMASQDTVSYDRTITSATDLDNGNLVIETVPATTTYGVNDLINYVGTVPGAAVATDIILVVDSGEVARIGGEFRVDTVDPRNNYVPATVPAKARQLVVGDEFAVSATAFTSLPTVTQFVGATNGTALFTASNATRATIAAASRLVCYVVSTWVFSVGKTNVAGYRLKVVAA